MEGNLYIADKGPLLVMGQTDDFLERVRRLEEDEALRGQNSKKPDPLGEEKLRSEMPEWHSDAESITRYHNYLIFKHKAICDWCKWTNSLYERDPVQFSEDVAKQNGTTNPMNVNHTGFSRWNGANKVSQDLRNGLQLRREGYTNKQILGYFRSLGYSQRAEEYVSQLDSIEEYENEARRRWEVKNQSPPAKKEGGGLRK